MTRTLIGTRMLMAAAVAFSVTVGAPAQTAAAQKPTVDIRLMSKPDPPKLGDNIFEVMLKGTDGKPIADADVSVMFFMAAMPAMKMPEMKNTIALKHVKDGTYAGTGKVMMAGTWDATVMVKRGGKDVASKKFPVTAK
jgi:Cu(I)/Ag(I) efflux system membrane fusion protein/cobalt-zinc-cadmium efflux system membrane fusion protein